MKIFAVLISLIATGTIVAAPAYGAPATTDTKRITNLVETDTVSDCNGVGSFTETFVSNGVIHTTTLANGSSFFTVTTQGTDTLVPSDPSLPTYTGHFAFWDGENLSQKTETDTLTQSEILFGSDGTKLRFTVVLHETLGPNGPVVDFGHSNCIQG